MSRASFDSYPPPLTPSLTFASTAKINPALWSIWNEGDERTGHVTFADYATTGSGISSISRPSFATELSSESYSISTAVGSDYANWVDAEYFV